MIFDDLDGELDSAATTAKKITVITKKLLPAGAEHLAVLAVQTLAVTVRPVRLLLVAVAVLFKVAHQVVVVPVK